MPERRQSCCISNSPLHLQHKNTDIRWISKFFSAQLSLLEELLLLAVTELDVIVRFSLFFCTNSFSAAILKSFRPFFGSNATALNRLNRSFDFSTSTLC